MHSLSQNCFTMHNSCHVRTKFLTSGNKNSLIYNIYKQLVTKCSGWFRHVQHVRPNSVPTKKGPQRGAAIFFAT